MIRIIVALILVFLICPAMAAGRPAAPSDLTILQLIQADATAALQDAQANQDVIAATCYKAIVDVATARIQASDVTGAGLLTIFQKLRDITRMNASPLGTTLIIGCAPLVQDAKLSMLQFFTNIGAAVLLKGILL